MELLKIGSLDVFYQRRCWKCGSLIKFEESEESSKIIHTFLGNSESRWITCPFCKSKVDTKIIGNRIAKRWYPND